MDSITHNWKNRLRIGLMVAGLGLLWLGQRVTLPPVFWYGVMILGGLGVIALGAGDIRTRRSSYVYDEGVRTETYYGLSAVIWGVLWIMLGVLLVVGALVLWMGLSDSVLGFLRGRPGPALIVGGLFMITYGLPSFLGAIEERHSVGAFLLSIPGRLFSLVLVLAGVTAVVVGLWELVAPAAYDAAWQAISQPFQTFDTGFEP